MATGTAGTAVTAYGPVSLVFGVGSVITLALVEYVGLGIPLLAGLLAVTFGIFGLVNGIRRAQSVLGLTSGSVSVVYFLTILATFA
ncbi:hypothetical protein LO762_09250 [Actinocorallia sp. API 0066]|uniref:hypothetical protein n=1 Tax=Actinocorallia sp. API 0066 TaxID=2896846 RepID=UPI001E57CB6D|nr:hypothetical protein [Actinocorallia sp. API 0066]MCD0449374.1 hypothetical protein [Actinocorallia sp. API 0066]